MTNLTDLTGLVEAARQATTPATLLRLQRGLATSDILEWLPGAGADEVVLHAEPTLTLLRVEIPPRTEYPPHDHLIPACIAVLDGRETNTFYRLTDGALTRTRETDTSAGAVLPMDEHVIHSVANLTPTRSTALHLYLGDLFHLSRTIWHPVTHAPSPYSDARYFSLARTTAPA